MFDKVYPGFITRTRAACPDLSLSELRYFVLSKLNLSYKEMAFMLGVSPNTVQVLRHGKASLIITSQLPVTKRHEVTGEKTIADAILDRIVHHAHRIKLRGESM